MSVCFYNLCEWSTQLLLALTAQPTSPPCLSTACLWSVCHTLWLHFLEYPGHVASAPLQALHPLPGAPFALLVARLASPYPSVQSLTSLLEAFPGTSPQPQGSPEPVLCFPWGWTSRTPIGRAACLVISATLPQGRNLLSWGCAQWLEQSPAHLSGMNQVPSSLGIDWTWVLNSHVEGFFFFLSISYDKIFSFSPNNFSL